MRRRHDLSIAVLLGFVLLSACSAGRTTPAAAVEDAETGLCREHHVPEDECGICHPELLARKKPGEAMKVRLPSAASARLAGIATAASSVHAVEDGIECVAELAFDQKRVATISSQVPGTIASIAVDLGTRVKTGEVLVRIAASATGEAQSDYLRALADAALHDAAFERERKLHAEGIASDQDLQVAEAAAKSATAAVRQTRQHLLVLGFSDAELKALASGQEPAADLELRAPFAGEIVDRTAVTGMLVEGGKPLFTLADTSTLWAMVDIPESQLARARVGQTVHLSVASMPGKAFTGKLTWLSPSVDERTRMARGRVELPNHDGLLKARMFARAFIVTGEAQRAVVVPRSAVQTIGGATVVFVRSEDDLYEARLVRLGEVRDGAVEVVAGLSAGDPVVVAGSFELKSQLLISRLGAGCTD
jgi:cobalt-zinc-cadmium efflux system membrane fusion protein